MLLLSVKKLNVDSFFIEAYARAIGSLVLSSLFVNWDNLNKKKIMQKVFVIGIAGVARM